jgi:O-antigen/teichoic acid export membrane protein
VLKILGVEDFGIYNIIGGIVVLFTFLNAAMTSATQRFLNYELGKNNTEEIKRIFSMSVTIHRIIAGVSFFLAETIGLWFLNEYINIPENRQNAANWVYQFSLLTFCIQIIRVPYNASIIAYEKMEFYAYIGIIETVLRLLLVYLLVIFNYDKVITYAILTFLITIIINISYRIYCRSNFTTCNYFFFWDKSLFKLLISFSGWSLLGNFATLGTQQGINILLNVFYGVTVNAATGIANQLSQALYSFISNFQTAFNPSIVKSYANNNNKYFIDIIFLTSKYSYYLLFIISIPILIHCDIILKIWLEYIPMYTIQFCRLMILFSLIDALSSPFWIAVHATGKIRNYQLLIGSIIILNLPISYISLKIGMPPESVFIIRLIINLLVFFSRLIYLSKISNFPIDAYIKEIITTIIPVSLSSFIVSFISNYIFDNLTILSSIISLLITILIIYHMGLKQREKIFIKKIITNQI